MICLRSFMGIGGRWAKGKIGTAEGANQALASRSNPDSPLAGYSLLARAVGIRCRGSAPFRLASPGFALLAAGRPNCGEQAATVLLRFPHQIKRPKDR